MNSYLLDDDENADVQPQLVKLYLARDSLGVVTLHARKPGCPEDDNKLLRIELDGRVVRQSHVSTSLGFKLDKHGQVTW